MEHDSWHRNIATSHHNSINSTTIQTAIQSANERGPDPISFHQHYANIASCYSPPLPPPPRSDFFCGPCDLIHGRPRDGLLLFRSIVSKKQVGSNSRRHSLSDDSRDAFSIMLFGASSIHRHHNHHNNGNTGSFGFCFYCISFQG